MKHSWKEGNGMSFWLQSPFSSLWKLAYSTWKMNNIDAHTDKKIEYHKPVKYSSITQNKPQSTTTENLAVQTPFPKLQLFLILLIQFSEPMSSVIIYPFINQFVWDTGITRVSYASLPIQKITSPQWYHLQIIQARLLWWPPFSQHILWWCCNHLGILSSMAEILLFNSVFHDRVTPVSVSTLKPLLRIIGVLPLKSQASFILFICI